jgi:hypothetical protein
MIFRVNIGISFRIRLYYSDKDVADVIAKMLDA